MVFSEEKGGEAKKGADGTCFLCARRAALVAPTPIDPEIGFLSLKV